MHLDHLALTLLLAFTGCTGASDTSSTVDTCKGGSCNTGPCQGGVSTPILDSKGAPTGYERCDDGSIHRPNAGSFSTEIPQASCAGTENYLNCDNDASCTEHPNGKCVSGQMVDGPETYCACAYSCGSDADCDPGNACVPAEASEGGLSYSMCVPAQCLSDADCASGECGVSAWDNGCGIQVQLACRSGADGCRTNTDCGTGTECGVDYGKTAFACNEQGCTIGRPLSIPSGHRVAPLGTRSDWLASLEPAILSSLSPALREKLAAYWQQVAALEHASVASFGRFSFQLLSLGAPPDLLREAQISAMEEIEHARMAFALASAYAGRPVGPLALPLQDVPMNLDFMEILGGLIKEGCVGETLGAAEALAACGATEDPVVRGVLEQIAEEEARHAALAWKTLRWMLALEPACRPVARRMLEAELGSEEEGNQEGMPELGVLGASERKRVKAEVLGRVFLPLQATLAA